jgi:hypothetical protein
MLDRRADERDVHDSNDILTVGTRMARAGQGSVRFDVASLACCLQHYADREAGVAG